MWTSIILLTGILAAVGSVVFADVPESVISRLESIAAGAMLTVIAETMLPEAYAREALLWDYQLYWAFLPLL